MFNRILLSSFALVITGTAAAQDMLRYGSSYSSFGLGELIDYRASYAEAMGVTGIAVYNTVAPGSANPAWLGTQTLTTAAFNGRFRSIEATGGGQAGLATQLQLSAMQLQLPIIKSRLGLSVALLPVSERSYTLRSFNVRASNDPNLRYDLIENGEGTLNRLELSAGFRLTANLYAGYTAGWYFGSLTRENVADFYNTSLSSSQQVMLTSHRGFMQTFAVGGKFFKAPKSGYYLIAGATLELPGRLTATRNLDEYVLSTPSSVGFPRNTTFIGRQQLDMPLSAGFGATVNVSPFLMTTAEALVQRWSDFSHPDDISGLSYRDRVRLGGGAQWSPNQRISRAWWRKYQYRAGAFMDSGNAAINGTRIATTGITAGISFPSPLSGSTIDVNSMLGFRGATTPGLVRETVFQLRLTLNLSEFMFFKRYIQ